MNNVKIESSSELLAFYKTYLKWVSNPDTAEIKFYISCGLCSNLDLYLDTMCYLGSMEDSNTLGIQDELTSQFFDAKLDVKYPFGVYDYDQRQENRRQHKCPNRLQWVRDRIKDMEGITEI